MQQVFNRGHKQVAWLMTDATCTDGCGLKWCTKLDTLFSLIYFCWLHKIGSYSTLHFFVLLCKLPPIKAKGSVYNAHLNFRGKICVKKMRIIHG